MLGVDRSSHTNMRVNPWHRPELTISSQAPMLFNSFVVAPFSALTRLLKSSLVQFGKCCFGLGAAYKRQTSLFIRYALAAIAVAKLAPTIPPPTITMLADLGSMLSVSCVFTSNFYGQTSRSGICQNRYNIDLLFLRTEHHNFSPLFVQK